MMDHHIGLIDVSVWTGTWPFDLNGDVTLQWLAERLAGWGQKYPQVTVRRHAVRDGAAHALVELSRGAQLVVVGSRGRGNATGLLLGSVSHGVLHGAHCPVAIVRPGTDG